MAGEDAAEESAEGQRDEQNYGENSHRFIHLSTDFVKFRRELTINSMIYYLWK